MISGTDNTAVAYTFFNISSSIDFQLIRYVIELKIMELITVLESILSSFQVQLHGQRQRNMLRKYLNTWRFAGGLWGIHS